MAKTSGPKQNKILVRLLCLTVIVVALIALLDMLPVALPAPGPNPFLRQKNEAPLIIPHGGAKILYPENTLYSFSEIFRRGWKTFEIDLCLTRDGVLVSHHDLSIDRTSDGGDRLVRDLDAMELRAFNFTSKFIGIDGKPFNAAQVPAELLVPATLRELFALYPDALYILELKDRYSAGTEAHALRAVDTLLRDIGDFAMEERVMLSTFDQTVMKHLRERLKAPEYTRILTNAVEMDALLVGILSSLRLDSFWKPSFSGLMIPHNIALSDSDARRVIAFPSFIRRNMFRQNDETGVWHTAFAQNRIVRTARRHRIALCFWTVNEEEDLRYLIDLGVDGIITDRPDIMEAILAERIPTR